MSMCRLCEAISSSGVESSRCAFQNNRFDPDNWNCGTVNLIRDLVYEGQDLPYFINYQYCDDQKYSTINISECYFGDSAPYLALWISWYKQRGTTDAMWLLSEDKLPKRPTETEIKTIVDFCREAKKAIVLRKH